MQLHKDEVLGEASGTAKVEATREADVDMQGDSSKCNFSSGTSCTHNKVHERIRVAVPGCIQHYKAFLNIS